MSTIALGFGATPTASPRAPRLHLTRRGRVVIGALLVAPIAVALAVSGISGGVAQADATRSSATFEYISVASGESLWDLAEWIAPDADPREVVAALVSLNQLPSAAVQPGQRLAIPAKYAR